MQFLDKPNGNAAPAADNQPPVDGAAMQPGSTAAADPADMDEIPF